MNLSGQITPVITRHFIDCGSRRVHYRRCGKGPPLLMVHQSPRSSAEYEALMRTWGAHFTCIAPDSPGFGQSDPLSGTPEINDFADAMVEFLDALGIVRVAAYGFHSGGIILVTALRRHPERFTGLAVGGYAIWTAEEMALFGESYLPPFVPSAYGEHLTWLWNRVLEQSWFFPWFDVRDEARLSVAHDDPQRVHAVVIDMLDAGDAYRAGYGAVLRAPRAIPPADAVTPPVLITAYDGDPLQAHIDRLGPMPVNWAARKVATPAEHHAESLTFLQAHAAPAIGAFPTVEDQGFAHIETEAFNGLIHWRGSHKASTRPASVSSTRWSCVPMSPASTRQRPDMPRWKIMLSPRSVSTIPYLARRKSPVTRAPVIRWRRSVGIARRRSGRRTSTRVRRAPSSAGSSPRTVVSTSGSSGTSTP